MNIVALAPWHYKNVESNTNSHIGSQLNEWIEKISFQNGFPKQTGYRLVGRLWWMGKRFIFCNTTLTFTWFTIRKPFFECTQHSYASYIHIRIRIRTCCAFNWDSNLSRSLSMRRNIFNWQLLFAIRMQFVCFWCKCFS